MLAAVFSSTQKKTWGTIKTKINDIDVTIVNIIIHKSWSWWIDESSFSSTNAFSYLKVEIEIIIPDKARTDPKIPKSSGV